MKPLTLLASALLVATLGAAAPQAVACTSAIISGKVTPDGRPILWKNRDSSGWLNCVRYLKGKKYHFVAVTPYSKNPGAAWEGVNEKGFAIINTVSYNLEATEDEGSGAANGVVLRRALGLCATVADFKAMLDTLRRPMRLESNFGVIDAQGGAAYFEVNQQKYTMYDVNDPLVAPHGYLVRANYSMSGRLNDGAGYVRYQEADQQLFTATATGDVTPQWVLNTLSRSYHNPLMGIDLTSGHYNKPHTNGWFSEQDFIARRTSASAVAIQGVKPGEDPLWTIMWTIVGYPSACPVIPIWCAGADSQLPAVTCRQGEKRYNSPLCDATDKMRARVYSYNRGKNTEKYFCWELLFNARGNGYMQQCRQIEDRLWREAYTRVDAMRQAPTPDTRAIHDIYTQADRIITDEFATRYGMKL